MIRNELSRIALLPLVFLVACSPHITEISRRTNASGTIDAVTVENEPDAPVPTPTEIYVVAHGDPVDGEAVFRADSLEGLVVRWDGEHKLIIHAEKARVIWQAEKVTVDTPGNAAQTVSVRYEPLARG